MTKTVPQHRRERLAAALGLALALLTGGALPSAAAAAAARGKPATIQGGAFRPGQPPAASYGPDKGASCPSGGAYRLVQDEVADAAKSAGKPAPEADGRLCAIADEFMGWDPAQGRPRPDVLAFVSQHHGLVSPVADVVVASIDTGGSSGSSESSSAEDKLVAERVLQPLGNFAVNAGHARYGLVLQQPRRNSRGGGGGPTRIVLVLQDVGAEVQPFPRRLAPNQSAALQGTLLPPYQKPSVLVSSVTGELAAPEQAAGPAFNAEVKCGDRPGTIYVEVRGERDGRAAAVANFPVACGAELPATVALAGEPWPQDAPSQEKKILEIVNGQRSAAGLKPLAWDAAVAGVARKLAGGLAENASKGTGGGGDVAKELKELGISSSQVVEVAGADRTVESANQRLLRSPRNRANLLNPDVTNAGVGVASAADAEGHPLVFVAEVLIKELPPVDVAKVREDLRGAVLRKRKDTRTTPLTTDPALDGLAQRYAADLAKAGGSLPKEQASPITAELSKSYRTVSIVKGAKAEPLDFAEEPEITGPGKLLGVGVAQGMHPTLGRNANYAVIMIATPRGAGESAGATRAPGAKPAAKAGKPAPKAAE
jgi:uncharacterized protein YkwD